jgi:hypothetical protein
MKFGESWGPAQAHGVRDGSKRDQTIVGDGDGGKNLS